MVSRENFDGKWSFRETNISLGFAAPRGSCLRGIASDVESFFPRISTEGKDISILFERCLFVAV